MNRFFSLGLSRRFLPQLSAELAQLLDPETPLTLGRVASGAHGRWNLLTPDGPVHALAAGPLRGDVIVGDWLVVQTDIDPPIARRRLDRETVLRRRSPDGGEQLVAANVDVALICTAVGRDFNLRRAERWLAIAEEAGCEPVVVLTKCDLGAETELTALSSLDCECLAVSAVTGEGLDELRARIDGQTASMLGSSGVGKSTLLNALIGAEEATGDVREDGKGRHTTTWRSLHALPGGGWLVDNPGVREVGLIGEEGASAAFADIEALTEQCRWRDCAHTAPDGCAVQGAIEAGELDADRFAAWQKLLREAAYEASRHDPVLRAEREAKWKRIHQNAMLRKKLEGKDWG